MSITPQAIKDQEFQTKFRGYDAIEVKAYLDLIAEEFFDLLEVKHRQEEEVATLQVRCQSLFDERNSLEEQLRAAGSALTKSDEESQRARDAELQTLRGQSAALMKQVKDVEAEKAALLVAKNDRERALTEEVRGLHDKLMVAQQDTVAKDRDVENLRRQVAASEMQIRELKKDETASKHLIIAAQNFADSLRHKSEKEAQEMMGRAHADIAAFRQKAQEEMARLPVEIERLHQHREQVWGELRHLLQTHLERLDFSSQFKESSPNIDGMFHALGAPGDEQAERPLEKDATLIDLDLDAGADPKP